MYDKKASKRVSVGGIITALTIVCLFLTNILPTGKLALYALSTMFIFIIVIEFGTTWAFVAYGATSILGLIIIPNKLILIPYILFFGYYAVIKYYIEKLNNLITEWIIKLIIFNVVLYLLYLIGTKILHQDISTIFPHMWITVILAQIAFIVYDLAYSIVIGYYNKRLSKILK